MCRVCLTVTEMSEEPFQALHLDVRDDTSIKSDLIETLSKFCSPETLSGDCMVSCDVCVFTPRERRSADDDDAAAAARCQTRTPTTVASCLTRLPDYLVVHLKRFAFDLESMTTVKLNHAIAFPLDIELAPYTKAGVRLEAKPEPAASVASERFALQSVVLHRGRAGAGHYFALGKEAGQWLLLNDDRVGEFAQARLPAECFGGNGDSSAFMLLYRRQGAADDDADSSDEDVGESAAAAMAATATHSVVEMPVPGSPLQPASLRAPELLNGLGSGGGDTDTTEDDDDDDASQHAPPPRTMTAPINVTKAPGRHKLSKHLSHSVDRRLAVPPPPELAGSLKETLLSQAIAEHRAAVVGKFKQGLKAEVAAANRAVVLQSRLFSAPLGQLVGALLAEAAAPAHAGERAVLFPLGLRFLQCVTMRLAGFSHFALWIDALAACVSLLRLIARSTSTLGG